MKISSVRARVYEWKGAVVAPRPNFCANATDIFPPVDDSMQSFRFHGWCVVEIESDTGLVGIGNAALAPRVAKQIIDIYLAPLLMNQDPFDRELLWQKMYRSTVAWGRKGVGMAAISALDIALWDLLGKVLNKPVFKLLGGRTKEKIPCYASKLYHTEIHQMQEEASSYVKQGFKAVKMRFGFGPAHGVRGVRRNLDAVAAVRDAIGPDIDLMLECYMGWNLEYTKRMLPRLARFEPRWLEEPVLPDDIAGYAELNAMQLVPISGGEHEFTVLGFQQLLDARAVSVVQYDANRVGGISAALKVNALAEAYGVPVIPHAGQMHNYHLTMASIVCPMSEFFPVHDVEIGNELFYYIFEGDPQPVDGMLDLDDLRPGLGLTLSTKYSDQFDVIQ